MTQHAAPKVYCHCGKPLRIKVRRDGAVLQCPDHGVVWRFIVNPGNRSGEPNPDRDRK